MTHMCLLVTNQPLLNTHSNNTFYDAQSQISDYIINKSEKPRIGQWELKLCYKKWTYQNLQWLRWPTHVPSHVQWWSNRNTHLSQSWQCFVLKVCIKIFKHFNLINWMKIPHKMYWKLLIRVYSSLMESIRTQNILNIFVTSQYVTLSSATHTQLQLSQKSKCTCHRWQSRQRQLLQQHRTHNPEVV